MTQTPEQLAAELYDTTVPDWDGEIDFYRDLARPVQARGQGVLEVGCGTGRVTIRLAQEGGKLVGTDLAEEMLGIARTRTADVRWVQGDMLKYRLCMVTSLKNDLTGKSSEMIWMACKK